VAVGAGPFVRHVAVAIFRSLLVHPWMNALIRVDRYETEYCHMFEVEINGVRFKLNVCNTGNNRFSKIHWQPIGTVTQTQAQQFQPIKQQARLLVTIIATTRTT
jgi:hypothetical protein